MTDDPTSPYRVLVVDDTPDIRELVALTLEVTGGGEFEVVGQAGDGREAITQAEQLRPDLVLLDLAMPIMDGLEALPAIRRAAPAAKVLVLSGFNARELGAEALDAGASGYMEKGGIAGKLVPRLRELMAPAPAAPAPTPSPSGAHDRTTEPALDIVELLAHELLSPVTVLDGYARLLSTRIGSMTQDGIVDAAEAIGRSAKQLAALVQSLADLKSVELDSLDLRVEPVDLGALVADCVVDLGYLTGSHTVEAAVPAGIVVIADPVRLRQILVNLLSNAVKFSPAGSPIRITAVDGEDVRLWVEDRGPGVPEDRRSELFGRFARLGSTHKGTGIGLHLSRAIARAHGGDLVLAVSTTGARFELSLPRRGAA
jgi:signal transduction histidine kinase